MHNASRDMKTPSKNQKEMLEIKNTVTEMEIVFDRFASSLDTIEERICGLEGISLENSQTEI
jgi:hypothetical protein